MLFAQLFLVVEVEHVEKTTKFCASRSVSSANFWFASTETWFAAGWISSTRTKAARWAERSSSKHCPTLRRNEYEVRHDRQLRKRQTRRLRSYGYFRQRAALFRNGMTGRRKAFAALRELQVNLQKRRFSSLRHRCSSRSGLDWSSMANFAVIISGQSSLFRFFPLSFPQSLILFSSLQIIVQSLQYYKIKNYDFSTLSGCSQKITNDKLPPHRYEFDIFISSLNILV